MSQYSSSNSYELGEVGQNSAPRPTDPSLWVIQTKGGYISTKSFWVYLWVLFLQNMKLVSIVSLIGLLSGGLIYWYH